MPNSSRDLIKGKSFLKPTALCNARLGKNFQMIFWAKAMAICSELFGSERRAFSKSRPVAVALASQWQWQPLCRDLVNPLSPFHIQPFCNTHSATQWYTLAQSRSHHFATDTLQHLCELYFFQSQH